MREATVVQRGEDALDLWVDPGVGPPLGRLGAQCDDALERGVGGDAVAIDDERLA